MPTEDRRHMATPRSPARNPLPRTVTCTPPLVGTAAGATELTTTEVERLAGGDGAGAACSERRSMRLSCTPTALTVSVWPVITEEAGRSACS